MATQDWPTDTAFAGAEFRPGVDVPKSTFRGFYTGNRGTTSHLADRLTCEVMLPPCVSRADAARREAFFMGLLSTGDWVRFGMLYRREPLGTMSGTPTVNGAVTAGARSLAVAGVRAAPNLLLSGSFEVDGNADGLADSWASYSAGTATGVAYALSTSSPPFGSFAQRITATNLGTTGADRIGVKQTVLGIVEGSVYSVAATMRWTQSGTASWQLYVDWREIDDTFITSSQTGASLTGTFTRYTNTVTAPALAAKADVYIYCHSRTVAGLAGFELDGAQFEVGGQANAFAGSATALAGDFIGIGGNLLQVAYAGAIATDAGAMTVPLVYPAPKAISNGAAVTLLQPTGTWELDTDGLQLDYTAGIIQGGIAVPFRQVPV